MLIFHVLSFKYIKFIHFKEDQMFKCQDLLANQISELDNTVV